MPKTETIRARVEPELKEEVGEVLDSLGLTATEAITLFYEQLVIHQGLPFDAPGSGAHTASGIPADGLNTGDSPAGSAVANGGEQPHDDSTKDKQPTQEPQAISDTGPAEPAQPQHSRKSWTAKALIALGAVSVAALVFNLVLTYTHSHDEYARKGHSHNNYGQELYAQWPVFPPQPFPMERGGTFQPIPPQPFPMQNRWMQEQPPQPFPTNSAYGCATEMWRQAQPEFLSLPPFFCLYFD